MGQGRVDFAVTSASWNIAPDDNLYLYSAVAPLTQGSPDSGVTGLTGGNIEVNTGNWNMGGLAQFAAGSGGAVTSSNGIGNQGGTGGSVSLTFNNLTFTGTQNLQISAGAGGAVTDTNGSGDQGGTGGAVIILGDNYSFSANGNQLQGGNGGSVTDSGNRNSPRRDRRVGFPLHDRQSLSFFRKSYLTSWDWRVRRYRWIGRRSNPFCWFSNPFIRNPICGSRNRGSELPFRGLMVPPMFLSVPFKVKELFI